MPVRKITDFRDGEGKIYYRCLQAHHQKKSNPLNLILNPT
jgi:hypothetical protein